MGDWVYAGVCVCARCYSGKKKRVAEEKREGRESTGEKDERKRRKREKPGTKKSKGWASWLTN